MFLYISLYMCIQEESVASFGTCFCLSLRPVRLTNDCNRIRTSFISTHPTHTHTHTHTQLCPPLKAILLWKKEKCLSGRFKWRFYEDVEEQRDDWNWNSVYSRWKRNRLNSDVSLTKMIKTLHCKQKNENKWKNLKQLFSLNLFKFFILMEFILNLFKKFFWNFSKCKFI